MPITHFKSIINLLKQIKYSTGVQTSEYFNIENTINSKFFSISLLVIDHLLIYLLLYYLRIKT